MNIVFLFIYSILVYSIANMFVFFNGPFNIITKFVGWISKKHSTFEELFSCMFCLPTNIGIVLSILSLLYGGNVYFTPFSMLWHENYYMWPLIIIFDGFYSGGITYIIYNFQQLMEGRSTNV